ncbi:MAG: hypothetical protein IBX70_14135 [Clostridia bacterium]|nr:hypothetical protein [Clostridia bacterium]
MRRLSDKFINDLLNGELSFFLNEANTNPNICLEIRNGYINLYYKGGNALKITESKSGYSFHFDSKYCKNKVVETDYSFYEALNKRDANAFEVVFPNILSEMDSWFEVHKKTERDFQQKLVKSNTENLSIVDIEYAGRKSNGKQFRLDMLGIYKDKLIIFENKFGNGAISGASGICKHYNDIVDIISDQGIKTEMIRTVQSIIDQKNKLGYIKGSSSKVVIKDIEIWFLFVNYKVNSKALKNEINKIHKSVPVRTSRKKYTT